MGIGPRVRRLFGKHERWISEIYRRVFVDLDALAAAIARQVPSPARILEVGCGEGMLSERLAAAFPEAFVTGIDVCPVPGRLYRGDMGRVRFLRTSVSDFAAIETQCYDLVVIADVLHHVPSPEWPSFLATCARPISDRGVLVLKDWTRESTVPYLMGYCADRFITGDRIKYLRENELRALAHEAFGSTSIRAEFRVPPWHCNTALLITPVSHRDPQ